MLRSFALVLSITMLVSGVHAAAPPDVEVTTCGQVVPKKTLGYLTADLDCTGYTGQPPDVGIISAGAAVYLEKKSRLDLRGFTIHGGNHAVLCNARVRANGSAVQKGSCEVFNGTITGTGANGNGIAGYRPIVHEVTITGVGWGVVGLDGVSLANSTIQGSTAIGVAGKKLKIVGTTITGSGFFGVDSWSDRGHGARLTDSTVTGNGIDPLCDPNPCADVASVKVPRLVNTTCGTSQAILSGLPWGVCSLD